MASLRRPLSEPYRYTIPLTFFRYCSLESQVTLSIQELCGILTSPDISGLLYWPGRALVCVPDTGGRQRCSQARRTRKKGTKIVGVRFRGLGTPMARRFESCRRLWYQLAPTQSVQFLLIKLQCLSPGIALFVLSPETPRRCDGIILATLDRMSLVCVLKITSRLQKVLRLLVLISCILVSLPAFRDVKLYGSRRSQE